MGGGRERGGCERDSNIWFPSLTTAENMLARRKLQVTATYVAENKVAQ